MPTISPSHPTCVFYKCVILWERIIFFFSKYYITRYLSLFDQLYLCFSSFFCYFLYNFYQRLTKQHFFLTWVYPLLSAVHFLSAVRKKCRNLGRFSHAKKPVGSIFFRDDVRFWTTPKVDCQQMLITTKLFIYFFFLSK